jgi:hypothetical protein
MKVLVLRDDGEAVILRVSPNRVVGRARESDVNDVRAIGICVRKLTNKTSRKIFVK